MNSSDTSQSRLHGMPTRSRNRQTCFPGHEFHARERYASRAMQDTQVSPAVSRPSRRLRASLQPPSTHADDTDTTLSQLEETAAQSRYKAICTSTVQPNTLEKDRRKTASQMSMRLYDRYTMSWSAMQALMHDRRTMRQARAFYRPTLNASGLWRCMRLHA